MVKSWWKEVAACNSERRPSTLNYKAIFDLQCCHEAFIPGLKPNEEVNRYTNNLLRTWRDTIENSGVLYPRMSSKLASRRTTDQLKQTWPDWRVVFDEESDMCSQEVLERLYADTGVQLEGPCEIRQKLYRSQMSPRTYFAQGGTAFWTSRFLQRPFTQLADVNPMTNHTLRLIPTNLSLVTMFSYVFIYDLTSFTSMFHEFEPFIRQLAEFMRGVTVRVWDGRNGEVERDFGQMLDIYADANAFKPTYSTARVPWIDGDQTFNHEVAGFLGVFGNLMICTFVHGIVLLQIVGEVSRGYCAGDDGGAVLFCALILRWGQANSPDPPQSENPFYNDVALLFYALSLLGIIQWAKVFTTLESGAVALKRPLRQLDDKLYSPLMIIWPQSILIQQYHQWSQIDPRFPFTQQFSTRREIRHMVGTENLRFQKNIFAASHRINDEDLQSVFVYLRWLYEHMGFPQAGLVPQYDSSTYNEPVVPRIEGGRDDLRKDPILRTLENLWTGSASVPIRGLDKEFELRNGYEDLYVGEVFRGPGSPRLKWLRQLRYLKQRKLFRHVEGEEGFRLLCSEYLDPYNLEPNLYEYTVVSLPPVLRTR
jgi:hypothetical protein